MTISGEHVDPAAPNESQQQFRYAPVPDSYEARRFVELSGYANADLYPALRALEAALHHESNNDPEMISSFLIEFAVVAYCRAFNQSKARQPLDKTDVIPAEFMKLHEDIYAFRNTTVAHSQSEISTTWPMLIIDHSSEPFVRDVQANTASQTLPISLVHDLVSLIELLLDTIDARREPIRERLLAAAQSAPVPVPPQTLLGLRHQQATDFDPRTTRKPYPTQQTFYYSAGREVSLPRIDARWSRASLEAAGFQGFIPWKDLSPDAAPTAPGVYVVLRTSAQQPTFLAESPASSFKGKSPTVNLEKLEAAWVSNAETLYIGKASAGALGKRGLRKRLSEYRRHGRGARSAHWGGRYIWQLSDSDELLVAWKATPDADPETVESELISSFVDAHGALPFANLKVGRSTPPLPSPFTAESEACL